MYHNATLTTVSLFLHVNFSLTNTDMQVSKDEYGLVLGTSHGKQLSLLCVHPSCID